MTIGACVHKGGRRGGWWDAKRALSEQECVALRESPDFWVRHPKAATPDGEIPKKYVECNQDGSEHAVRKRLSGQVRSGAAVRILAAEDLFELGRFN